MLLVVAALEAALGAQAIEVPYRGLEYSMLSKDGVTVMVAPLELSILKYSAAHVWVTNGTSRAIQVSPQAFTVTARHVSGRHQRQPKPAEYAGAAEGLVVEEVMRKARFGDVMSLVRAYERNLYGFRNPQATGYYQARKQAAAAEGSRKLRAGAMVSILILPKSDIPAGEFREGTVFFPTGDKKSELLSFTARVAGQSFVFAKSP